MSSVNVSPAELFNAHRELKTEAVGTECHFEEQLRAKLIKKGLIHPQPDVITKTHPPAQPSSTLLASAPIPTASIGATLHSGNLQALSTKTLRSTKCAVLPPVADSAARAGRFLHKALPKPAILPDDPHPRCWQCRAAVHAEKLDLHWHNACPKNPSSEHSKQVELRKVLPHRSGLSHLPFELLPEERLWTFEVAVRRPGIFIPASFASTLDFRRVRLVEQHLKGTLTHVGLQDWYGYGVYRFGYSAKLLLETAREGNAAYIIDGDWNAVDWTEVVRQGKGTLRTDMRVSVCRFWHTGDWLSRLREELKRKRKAAITPERTASGVVLYRVPSAKTDRVGVGTVAIAVAPNRPSLTRLASREKD